MKSLWLSTTISEKKLELFNDWLLRYVLTYDNLVQALIITCALLIAFLFGNRIKRRFSTPELPQKRFGQLLVAVLPLATPLLWLFLQIISLLVAMEAEWPHDLLTIVVNLLAVWIVIKTASLFFNNTAWIRLITVIAWTLAALNILDLLGPAVRLLDRLSLKFGKLQISLLTVLTGFLTVVLLLWGARLLSHLLEKRIRGNASLSPSIQVLFVKLSKITLITVAILVGLRSVGLDLTGFTIFTGAVGVGIGFGLQKIFSNLISGIILLLDKSIKPGDVITVGETYGWVNSLGARYTSLIAPDGKEFLIPNEDLITQQVENWSFSNSTVCVKMPVGIAYSADVRKAMALCEEAARQTERIIQEPPPQCLLVAFGESSVDLELGVWINDPINGVKNVKSAVLLNIWDAFHEQGIEIPYPQRDVHIRTMPPGTGGMAGGQEEGHRQDR
ncbi:mechanosensitive ion channel family protein [Thiovibrio frasassiensis]|uniref:Mechanosensitive ion channel n=1 Tax=Thiovibrio frasassiensis TaxID=2984131 RepID=A0A9X4ME97_9BACT|nr:mechanosensitive ion channel domain-containing protein [Thiovibrio frasassiensis]MDG4474730.1 mechanosensitive ion channel [Thiovibrio frasassiensis]